MAGLNLGSALPMAASINSGINQQARENISDEEARLQLEQMQRQNEEQKREYNLEQGARGVDAQAWQAAQADATKRNAQAQTDYAPQEVKTVEPAAREGGVEKTMYRNKLGDFNTPEEARAGIPQADARTLYEREHSKKVSDFYHSQGRPDKALAYNEFVQSQSGQRYLQDYHRGLQQLAMGDKDGAMNTFQNLYNSQFPDGKHMRWEDNGLDGVNVHVFDGKGNHRVTHLKYDEIGEKMIMGLDPHKIAQFYATNITNKNKVGAELGKEVYMATVKNQLDMGRDSVKMDKEFDKSVALALETHRLDALFGKGTQVWKSRIPGDPDAVLIPGVGLLTMETGKDGTNLKPIVGGAIDPSKYVVHQDATPSNMPIAHATSGGLPIPQAAVQRLQQNDTPGSRQAFDQMYGEGKAAAVMGAPKRAGVTVPQVTTQPKQPSVGKLEYSTDSEPAAPVTGVAKPAAPALQQTDPRMSPSQAMASGLRVPNAQAREAAMLKQFDIETREIETGRRRDYSPEVKQYMVTREQAQRNTMPSEKTQRDQNLVLR